MTEEGQKDSTESNLLEEQEAIKKMLDDYERNTSKYKYIILLLVPLYTLIGYMLYLNMPYLSDEEKSVFFNFSSEDDIQNKISIIKKFSEENSTNLLFMSWFAYLVPLSFGIPGVSHQIVIITAAIFGPIYAFIQTTVLVCIGSSLCYYTSQLILKGRILRWKPSFVYNMSKKISSEKQNLYKYMILQRINPLIPNTVQNLCSSTAQIPFSCYITGCFLGQMPLNFLQVQTGSQVHDIGTMGFGYKSTLTLVGISVIGFIPRFFKKKEEDKEKVE